MDKLTFFRALKNRLPAVMEKAINLWGTSDLNSYIDRLISEGSRPGLELTTEMVAVLNGLKQIHAAEFPQYAPSAPSPLEERLAKNEHFQIINRRFPHIGAKLVATWGRVAFHQYLETLFKNDRGIKRQGFSEETILAIFRLTEQHDLETPGAVPKSKDVWDNTKI